MNRTTRSVITVAGALGGLLVALTLMIRPGREGNRTRLLVIGVEGMSWDDVTDGSGRVRWPHLSHLLDGHAAYGDIVSRGYGSEGEIRRSILSGMNNADKTREMPPLWRLLSGRGGEVSVLGFADGAPGAAPSERRRRDSVNVESAVSILRSAPGRHVFLYLTGLSGEGPTGERLEYSAAVDSMVAELTRAAGDQTSVLLFSEQGNRGGRVSSGAGTPGRERRPAAGCLLAWGRGIKPSARPHTVNPYDIVPTLLYLAGEPIPEALDGVIVMGWLEDGFFFKNRIRVH